MICPCSVSGDTSSECLCKPDSRSLYSRSHRNAAKSIESDTDVIKTFGVGVGFQRRDDKTFRQRPRQVTSPKGHGPVKLGVFRRLVHSQTCLRQRHMRQQSNLRNRVCVPGLIMKPGMVIPCPSIYFMVMCPLNMHERLNRIITGLTHPQNLRCPIRCIKSE